MKLGELKLLLPLIYQLPLSLSSPFIEEGMKRVTSTDESQLMQS
jgi:hypothetical protein